MQQWIIGILAAGILSAILMAVAPEGTGKKLLGMACGTVMAMAVLSPLADLALDNPSGYYAEYEQKLEQLKKNITVQNENSAMRLISENLAAYIVNKAAGLGVRCDCEVTLAVDENGTYSPYAITVTYPESPGEAGLVAMKELIRSQFGIAEERQNHHFGSKNNED